MLESLENLIKWAAGGIAFILSALGVRHLLQFVTNWRKTNIEAKGVHTSTDISIHDMQAADLKEYRELFKQAEKEIRESREHWINAAFFVKEMLFKLKQHNIPGWEEDEKRFNEMFGGK